MSSVVAVLGRQDKPADGVEDYCIFLARALAADGIDMQLTRVQWAEKGWIAALWQLSRASAHWRGQWALVQYTALSWSRHGFPFGAIAVLAILRRRGVRCAVVFHEPSRQSETSTRWIDRIRGACQDWAVRALYNLAGRSIFADPLVSIRWLPRDDKKAIFIPIGANIPAPPVRVRNNSRNDARRTVVVFCLSDPPNRRTEVEDIFHALRFASECGLQLTLVFLGRGTPEATEEIERAFKGSPVEVSNLGLRTAEDVSRILEEADAMLCVRGKLFPRRGSALAGVVCGLPVIAYAGASEGTPLAEAGIVLVPYRDTQALATALVKVLSSQSHWQDLHEKSLMAKQKYFSWESIAEKLIATLNLRAERA